MIRHSSLAFPLALGALLFWAPLPFGSVGSGFRVLLWGLLVAIFLGGIWLRETSSSWRSARTAVWCLLAVAGVAMVQSLMWPPGLVRLASPGHYRLAETFEYSLEKPALDGSEVVSSTSKTGTAVSRRIPLSFSTSSSRRAALAWTMMAVGLFCGAMLSSRLERRVVLGGLVCAAVFQVIYGGPRLFGGADLIWAQAMPSAEGRFRGTFVNPNHAAFFVGLVLPLVTAWLWLAARRLLDGDYRRLGVLYVGLPAMVWLLLAGGLFLTQSRTGAVAMMVTLAVQVVLMLRRSLKTSVVAGAAGAAGTAVGLWWLLRSTSGGLVQRFWEARISASTGEARGTVYHAVLSLWGEFPLFGAGLGSFRSLFSARGPAELRGQWWNAHSDWLELLVTGGLVCMVPFFVAWILVVRGALRSLSSVSRERRATGIAVLGSLIAASLHSLVDFGLAMPANALGLAIVAGLGLAPARVRRPLRKPGVDSP